MDNLSYGPDSPPKGPPKKSRSFFGKIIRGHGSDTSSAQGTDNDVSQPPKTDAGSSANASDDSLPPLSDLNLRGYAPNCRHRLLDKELAADIRSLLPARLQLFDDWELIYSLEQHGVSLNTLYRNSSPEHQREKLRNSLGNAANPSGSGYAEGVVKNMVSFTPGSSDPSRTTQRPHGYIMVIQDEKKNKFGCFLNEHLRPNDHRRYYGNGECFLWKCEWFEKTKLGQTHAEDPHRMSRFKAFMYTGINDNLIYSNQNSIAIGSSSGNNGLWIDKSLYSGVSYPCDTFGNEILNEHGETGHKFGKFKIISLELWRVGNLA
ncbi:hypothetical protein JCM33374_g6153 [Metschnikowia sp. JCM 33374]|nr:hypothetical protein JCM33374_g6153 [Metschnikowia sp. JCM 33374]